MRTQAEIEAHLEEVAARTREIDALEVLVRDTRLEIEEHETRVRHHTDSATFLVRRLEERVDVLSERRGQLLALLLNARVWN